MILSCVYIEQCSFIHYITLNIKKYRAVFTSSCVYIEQCSFIHYITLNIRKYRAVFTWSSACLYFTLLHQILNDIELCYHKQRGIYMWGEMRDVLRGIPCSPRRLCQLQTAVGLCACTLGWAVSESIVGIVQGCVRGFPAWPNTVVWAADNCWPVHMHSGMGCKWIYCGERWGMC